MKNLLDILKSIQEGTIPRSICIRGDDSYIFQKLITAYKKKNFDLKRFDVSSSGPGSQVEAEAFSLSLFGGGVLLWLESKKSLSSWSEASSKLFERLLESADGQGLVFVFNLPEDRRLKVPKGFQFEFSAVVSHAERMQWIGLMNEDKGNKLDASRLSFLSHFEDPLAVVDNWMELWTLGGDLWAKTVLCWGDSQQLDSRLVLKGENPAFAWVDAVIDGNKTRALKLLDYLLKEGSDPIQLTALLSKSARIAASLAAGESIEDFPPFLVSKLKAKKSQRSIQLLYQCAAVDLSLKSSPQDARALLLKL